MNFLTAKTLPRRTVLRGIGASLALPFLEAMVPSARAAVKPVRRFLTFYTPNGMAMKQNAVHELEGVIQHQLLELTIVRPTPESALQKCVAHGDFRPARIVIVVRGAPDDAAGLWIEDRKRPSCRHDSIEILLKNVSGVAVALGMLFPDEGIAGSVKQFVEIRDAKGA